ncbi:MAG: Glycerol-3-phosphate dehydrogenase [Myxococcaceae bacterium]|nr:Glycerol-3-phosphate dehydrogenase [Myxococcaceae bacterium]
MAKMSAVVVGGGSWGTALAKVLAENGYQTRLWCRELDLVETINTQHVNSMYMPGIPLPENLTAHGQLADALTAPDVKMVMLVVPSHHLRAVSKQLVDLLPSGVPIMSAVKGIENDSLEFPSQILEGTLPARLHPQLTFLSGPSFAKEVALGVPTGVLVASRDEQYACLAQDVLGNQRLRVYRTDDVIGVEIGGCLKNVVAIAAGISDGLGFGHNSRAALITRGLAEIGRLAAKLGAHPLTVSGLSGMGDLVLTCTGDLSRNRHVGIELGKGKKLPQILSEMTMVAEGVLTAKSAYQLSRREDVEMPITEGIYRVLYEHSDPREEVAGLMARSPRAERD